MTKNKNSYPEMDLVWQVGCLGGSRHQCPWQYLGVASEQQSCQNLQIFTCGPSFITSSPAHGPSETNQGSESMS